MRSLSNIIADKNVDEKPRRCENSKNIFFLENLDLELMNDLENSVNKFSPENSSQASSANFSINSAQTTFGNKRSRNIRKEKSKVCVSKKP